MEVTILSDEWFEDEEFDEENIQDEDITSRVTKRDRRIGTDKAVTNKKEEYIEEEKYIDNENDPQAVEKITEEDTVILLDDVKMDFDEVFETVKTKITNLTNHDHMMEKKLLDSLRRGKIK